MSVAAIYVDASVIAGLVLGDISSEDVGGVVDASAELTFNRFGFGEVVAAITARVRRLGETDEDAENKVAVLRTFLNDWRELPFDPRDFDRAIELAGKASLALKYPDALHVAAAERLALPLLTADRQQERAARLLGVPTLFLTIKD